MTHSVRLDVIACCIVLNEKSELLLLQRHSHKPGGGLWAVPGGRIDAGETASAAAVRELEEETGIQMPHLKLLGVHAADIPHSQVHMTSFLMRLDHTPDIHISDREHQAYRWLSLEAVTALPNLLWGTPTVIYDFGLLAQKPAPDPTLDDGSTIRLIRRQADANSTS
jgi:mutator protein MutT